MPLRHKGVITILTLILYLFIENTSMELIFAFGLILIMGIPHGATDHLLSQHIDGESIRKWPLWKFLSVYLFVMGLYATLWYFYNGLAFALFLSISAYHFGEAQLIHNEKKGREATLSYFLWGCCALLVLFLPHLAQMKVLIIPYLMDSDTFHFFQNYDVFFLIGIGSFLFILLLISSPHLIVKEGIELIMLFIISSYTSLLVAFAVFFAFWHSYDSASFQLSKLSELKKGFDLRRWIKKATPYTIISWTGILVIVLMAMRLDLGWPLITLFFVLVSLITLPHVIIMSRFYSSRQ